MLAFSISTRQSLETKEKSLILRKETNETQNSLKTACILPSEIRETDGQISKYTGDLPKLHLTKERHAFVHIEKLPIDVEGQSGACGARDVEEKHNRRIKDCFLRTQLSTMKQPIPETTYHQVMAGRNAPAAFDIGDSGARPCRVGTYRQGSEGLDDRVSNSVYNLRINIRKRFSPE